MKVFNGISELAHAVGSHLGYSDWHTITQQQIDTFADATGDHQWIHVDPDKAGVRMGVNYGADRVRFPSAVPVDSRVRAGMDLLSVAPVASGYQVGARVMVDREGADKPACVVDTVSVLVMDEPHERQTR